MKEKTPGERLKDLRIKRGYGSARDVCRAFGWNEATYRGHENGFRGMRVDAAQRYARALGSSAAFILTGQEDGRANSPIGAITQVPVVGIVSAGAFRLADEIEVPIIRVPAVSRPDIPDKVQYSVIVQGESVNKRIANGAFAICAPLEYYPGGLQHGQLVHVVRERAGLFEHTIKEMQFTRDGMMLAPTSSDPQFQAPIKLNEGAPEDDITVSVQGVVIGAFQPI